MESSYNYNNTSYLQQNNGQTYNDNSDNNYSED